MKQNKSILIFVNVTISILFFSLQSAYTINDKHEVGIIRICHDGVVDKWNNPEKYSPLNAFDNDLNTAVGLKNDIPYYIVCELDELVTIDKIKVNSGIGFSEKDFVGNGRPKKIVIKHGVAGDYKNEVVIELKDTYGWQEHRLLKPLSFKSFLFRLKGNHLQDQRGDLFVSEIEFWNGNRQIVFKDIKNEKQKYIASIQSRLTNIFTDKQYTLVWDTGGISAPLPSGAKIITYCIVNTYKNGTLCSKTNVLKRWYRWKVVNARLYIQVNGKWIHVKYESGSLYTIKLLNTGTALDSYWDSDKKEEGPCDNV